MPVLSFNIELAIGGRMLLVTGPDGHSFSAHPPVSAAWIREFAWYLDSFPSSPFGADRSRALRLQQSLIEVGQRLGQLLRLDDLVASGETSRIAINSASAQVHRMPWELARFESELGWADERFPIVRTVTTTNKPKTSQRIATSGPVRCLLVIARPRAARDVPFAGLAAGVVRAAQPHSDVAVELLRPPTRMALVEKLMSAARAGKPYSVVHFDGHGRHDAALGAAIDFETPKGGTDSVPAQQFAAMVGDAGVKTVVLNACGSAHAEDQDISFARPLLAAGVDTIVAMSHSITAGSAASFADRLYSSIFAGKSFAVAVAAGRRVLRDAAAASELGTVDASAVPLLFGKSDYRVCERPGKQSRRRSLPETSPVASRDGVLLSLEAAAQVGGVIGVWGPIGSGKSTALRSFALWFSETSESGNCELFDLSKVSTAEIGAAPVASGVILDNVDDSSDSINHIESLARSLVASGAKFVLMATRFANSRYDREVMIDQLEPEEQHIMVKGILGREPSVDNMETIGVCDGNALTIRTVLSFPSDVVRAVSGEPYWDRGRHAVPTSIQRALGYFSDDELTQISALTHFGLVVEDELIAAAVTRTSHYSNPGAVSSLLSRLTEVGLAHPIDEGILRCHPLLRPAITDRTKASPTNHSEAVTVHAQLAASVTDLLRQGRQELAVRTVDRQFNRLVTTTKVALSKRRWTEVVELLGALAYVSEIKTNDGRLVDLAEDAERTARFAEGQPLTPAYEAWSLACSLLARADRISGRYEHAETKWNRIIVSLEECSDVELARTNTCIAYRSVAALQLEKGDFEGSLHWARQAAARAESITDKGEYAGALHQLGMAMAALPTHLHGSKAIFEKAILVSREVGDLKSEADSLFQLAECLERLAAYEEAEEVALDALTIFEALSDARGISMSHHQLGLILQQNGKVDAALRSFRRALRYRETSGDLIQLSNTYHQIGAAEWLLGKAQTAQEWLQRSLEIERELDRRLGISTSLGMLAMIEHERSNTTGAVALLREALIMYDQIPAAATRDHFDLLVEISSEHGIELVHSLWQNLDPGCQLPTSVLNMRYQP